MTKGANLFVFMELAASDNQTTLEIRELLSQLSKRDYSSLDVDEICKNPTNSVAVAYSDGRIIGVALIIIYQTLTNTRGWIEDVVVDEQFRHQGVGRELIKKLIKFAAYKEVDNISLTSNPGRENHDFYKKFGFEIYDTDLYRISFNNWESPG